MYLCSIIYCKSPLWGELLALNSREITYQLDHSIPQKQSLNPKKTKSQNSPFIRLLKWRLMTVHLTKTCIMQAREDGEREEVCELWCLITVMKETEGDRGQTTELGIITVMNDKMSIQQESELKSSFGVVWRDRSTHCNCWNQSELVNPLCIVDSTKSSETTGIWGPYEPMR